MTPAGFTIILVYHLQWRRLHRARGTCSYFLQIAGNGGHQTPYHGFAPRPNWGTSVFQITWPHTEMTYIVSSGALNSTHSLTITEGPCPRQWVRNHRARGRAPIFTNSWARRTTWGKRETHQSVLSTTKALAKMTNCTRRAIHLNNFLYENKSGTGTLAAAG